MSWKSSTTNAIASNTRSIVGLNEINSLLYGRIKWLEEEVREHQYRENRMISRIEDLEHRLDYLTENL